MKHKYISISLKRISKEYISTKDECSYYIHTFKYSIQKKFFPCFVTVLFLNEELFPADAELV